MVSERIAEFFAKGCPNESPNFVSKVEKNKLELKQNQKLKFD